jgi:cell wall-associated NlpC family hydrolase
MMSSVLVAAAAPAGAMASPGGTAPVSPSSTTAAPTSTSTAKDAPITARSSSIVYKGPVYEKTVSGQIVPYVQPTSTSQLGAITGGSLVATGTTPAKPQLLVPGARAKVINGQAAAPMSAPPQVQEIIWSGNQLIGLPYIYGGGHASFTAPGYDCSGTVSYALHGADLLETPMDSSEFESWEQGGIGQWVTVFANPGHAYMTVAGIRLDTSAADDPSNQQGPRWRPLRQNNAGYTFRHPVNL